MEIKEKLKNINKKFLSMSLLFILVAIVFGIGGYEYSRFEIVSTHKRMMAERQKQVEALQAQSDIKKPSEYQVGIAYEDAKKSDKPVMILFYADWCRYCIKFMPIFEKISQIYGDKLEFTKINVEDPKYEKVVAEAELGGFPTVMIRDFKYDDNRVISNSKLGDEKTLGAELEKILKIRTMLDAK